MREKFVLHHYQDEQFEKLLKLKQEHMGVGEYAKMFKTLLRWSELKESPMYTIANFVNGLNYNIAKSISHLIF